MSDVPTPDLLPCGCLITYYVENGANTMQFAPCRMDCPELGAVLAEMRQRNVPIETRVV